MSPALRWVLDASLVMAGALGIGRFAYTPLLPDMVATFGWSYGQAGDVASANFLGYLAGALIAPLVARSPYVRAYVALSLMASVGTTALGAMTVDFFVWLALRFFAGIASAFCLVVLTAHLLQVLAREDANHLGSIHFAGVGIGILLCMAAVYLGGTVEEQWARQGLVSAVVMAGAWFALSNGPWHAVQATQDSAAAAADNRSELTRLTIGYGFFGFGYVVSATFVVAMGDRLGQAGINPDLSWVVVGAATVPSVYLWQWLSNRSGLGFALRLSYLVLAVGAVLAGVASSMAMLFFAAALLGGTFGGVTALGLSAGRALALNRVAAIVSSMTVAFSVGQLLGPAVAGRMADATGGFMWPSVLAGGLVLLAAVLLPQHPALRREAQ